MRSDIGPVEDIYFNTQMKDYRRNDINFFNVNIGQHIKGLENYYEPIIDRDNNFNLKNPYGAVFFK